MRTNRRFRRLLLVLSLAPLILIPALTRIRLPSSPKRHPHTRPLPQTPQPFPISQPRPAYIPNPILIATATAAALAASVLTWLLASRRHKRLATSVTTLTHQLIQRNAAIITLEHTLTAATRTPFHRNTTPQQTEQRASPLLAQAEPNKTDLTDVANTANQLRFVTEATLIPRRVLGRGERIVFFAALRAIKTANDASRSTRYSLAFQISMGEFLATPKPTPDSSAADEDQNNRGFRSINSKRSDFLIYTRPDFLPALVIEYHGPGHYQGSARARDAVKRAALKRAGIPLLETDCIDPALLHRQISAKLATLPHPAAT